MDSRARLMEDIQKGKKLKPISQREGSADTKPAKTSSKTTLADLIMQQIEKKAEEIQKDQDNLTSQNKSEESDDGHKITKL